MKYAGALPVFFIVAVIVAVRLDIPTLDELKAIHVELSAETVLNESAKVNAPIIAKRKTIIIVFLLKFIFSSPLLSFSYFLT